MPFIQWRRTRKGNQSMSKLQGLLSVSITLTLLGGAIGFAHNDNARKNSPHQRPHASSQKAPGQMERRHNPEFIRQGPPEHSQGRPQSWRGHQPHPASPNRPPSPRHSSDLSQKEGHRSGPRAGHREKRHSPHGLYQERRPMMGAQKEERTGEARRQPDKKPLGQTEKRP